MDGKQLRRYFHKFNREYFGHRLPPYRIRVVSHITWLGESGRCNKNRKLIEIRTKQSDEDTLSILLHEMVHAATNEGHGKQFRKEMMRLCKAGAPLTEPDKRFTAEEPYYRRVTRNHFRMVMEDILRDTPVATLTQAIRYFIFIQGGANSAADFLRRYPWARHDFLEAKKRQKQG